MSCCCKKTNTTKQRKLSKSKSPARGGPASKGKPPTGVKLKPGQRLSQKRGSKGKPVKKGKGTKSIQRSQKSQKGKPSLVSRSKRSTPSSRSKSLSKTSKSTATNTGPSSSKRQQASNRSQRAAKSAPKKKPDLNTAVAATETQVHPTQEETKASISAAVEPTQAEETKEIKAVGQSAQTVPDKSAEKSDDPGGNKISATNQSSETMPEKSSSRPDSLEKTTSRRPCCMELNNADPNYPEQHLIVSSFVRNGRVAKTWTYRDNYAVGSQPPSLAQLLKDKRVCCCDKANYPESEITDPNSQYIQSQVSNGRVYRCSANEDSSVGRQNGLTNRGIRQTRTCSSNNETTAPSLATDSSSKRINYSYTNVINKMENCYKLFREGKEYMEMVKKREKVDAAYEDEIKAYTGMMDKVTHMAHELAKKRDLDRKE